MFSVGKLDMNDNKTTNDINCCDQPKFLTGSNENMAEERPECEPITDINLVDSSYNIWDIDIETLILEDEGGESLTDSDEEDYRNEFTHGEKSQSCQGHKNQDQFSHSIKAWGNLKEHSSQGQRPKSVNLRSASNRRLSLQELDRARSAGIRDGTAFPASSGVSIRVQGSNSEHFDCVAVQKGDAEPASGNGGFLHPDMVYSVIAEKVIEKYRTRANSDSSATTARMAKKVCSFQKNFMEKMAQRRRSLPVVPRRLEPLPPQAPVSDSTEEQTPLRYVHSLDGLSGLTSKKTMPLSRSSGSLNMMDPVSKEPFTKDKFMVLPNVGISNVSSSPQVAIEIPQQEVPT